MYTLSPSFPQLSSQMGSSSEERSRLEELGSEVAQLRERMSEVDRAVTALTNTGIIHVGIIPVYLTYMYLHVTYM